MEDPAKRLVFRKISLINPPDENANLRAAIGATYRRRSPGRLS